MRVLLLCHSFNSLTQRLFVELQRRGDKVSVEFDIHEQVTVEAAELWQPDVVVASFMKRRIPAAETGLGLPRPGFSERLAARHGRGTLLANS